MSRRSRRHRKPGRGSWVMGAVAVAMVLAAVVMAGGYLWVKSWLHSEGFRKLLSREAGKALAVEGEFGAFRWDGTLMRTPSFDAEGEGLVRKIGASGMEVDIEVGAVKRRVLELTRVHFNQVEAELDLRKGEPDVTVGTAAEAPLQPAPAKWYQRFLPQELELKDLQLGTSSLRLLLESGTATISGTGWQVMPDQAKGTYTIEAKGGELVFPWTFAPRMELGEARLRYQDPMVFVTQSDFAVYERGRLRLSGEASLRGGTFSFDGELKDVSAAEMLPEDWKQRIEGEVGSVFTVSSSEDRGLEVAGDLELRRGVLTGLPLLDSLGAYGGNQRFRTLVLSDARTSFRWEGGNLILRGMEIGSEGLMRLEGTLRVGEDDSLDGRFRLGLVAGTLDTIPGAETKVFLPGERGLLWTDLRITGSIDDPKEDLSERLIRAAGERMFEILPETGERVLKFTRRVVGEDLSKRLDQGGEVIRQGRDVIRQGKDLLDGEDGLIRGAGGVVRGVGSLLDDFLREDQAPEPE